MPPVELLALVALFLSQIFMTSAGPVPYNPERAGSLTRRQQYNSVPIVRRQENAGEQSCNGSPLLCDRKYSNVTFLGSHDSFADSPHWYAISRTQEVPLEAQMKMGVRLLQAQSHMYNGQLHFCHTTCGLFDGGTVEAYLLKVKKFLDENPTEIFTFIWTNPKFLSIDEVFKPLFEKTGMDKYAYIPPRPIMTRGDWPTLREMIDTGKRLVVFIDKNADKPKNPEKEYILPQFKMMWEDVHNPTDASFPCSVHRTQPPLLPTQQLYLINHNLNYNLLPIGKGLKVPDTLNAPRTNGIPSIYRHAANCASIMDDQNPNYVMLDFVNIGFGMHAVNHLNGLV
ncbi:PLC-like phosphodiesterase [Coprinopsis marcescibilis]|uniref:PLC-like phosphodiesterase n=1 Tax=Coprinopsis marcescibilis TaxID=230819 RepID=A0A5C3KIZ1_COPMA|nr:PLC-like phosphodiesterase [Coprinopsis marcescibilis]